MSRICVISWALVALCCLGAQAQNICSQSSVRGTYAVSYQGSVYQYGPDGTPSPAPIPVVLLGEATVNGSTGALSGHGHVTVGPQTMTLTFSGSVEIRPDCTATATYFLQPGTAPAPSPVPVKEEWVVLKGTDRIRVIVTEFPFGRQVTLGVWERLTIWQ